MPASAPNDPRFDDPRRDTGTPAPPDEPTAEPDAASKPSAPDATASESSETAKLDVAIQEAEARLDENDDENDDKDGDANDSPPTDGPAAAALALLALAALLALTLGAAPAAHAQIVVTSRGDNGPGTLRHAIASATDGEKITFAAALDGRTIQLTGLALSIDDDLIIDAEEQSVTVKATPFSPGNYRSVFTIASGAEVTLRDLTITGASGGGIFSQGTLRLEHCAVVGNEHYSNGGGIYNEGGALTIEDSRIGDNKTSQFRGGGVYNVGGALTIRRSAIYDNSARHYGGVGTFGAAATIRNTTFSGNFANQEGGALGLAQNGLVTIRNSTFSGNSAVPAAHLYLGGGTTSSGNPLDDTEIRVSSTIFHDNKGLGSGIVVPGLTFGTDNLVSEGYNLCDESPAGCGRIDGPGDRTNTDPLLASLQYNGGPTPTHLPAAGSPVLDAGDCNGLFEDQRGFSREVELDYAGNASGDACDVGAVEATAEEVARVVDTAEDTDDGDFAPGDRSLRETIDRAASGETIRFDGALDGQTITLSGTRLTLDKDFVIDAEGQSITIDGDDRSRVFFITSGAEVTLRGLTVTGGSAPSAAGGNPGGGGGVYNAGTLTVDRSYIHGNQSVPGGGGLRNAGALTVENSTVSGNTARFGGGGGIFSNGPSIAITNSTVSGNTGADGAGLFASNAIEVNNSTFAANTNTSSEEARNIIVYGSSSLLTIGSTVLDRDGGGPNLSIRSGGLLTTSGFNVCDDACGGLLFKTDQTNTEPLLGPLADNGGPMPTHLPAAGSPVLDAGNCRELAEDQRGFSREVEIDYAENASFDACDVGAVEVTPAEAAPPLVVDTGEGADDGDLSPGDRSLRELVTYAPAGAAITFDESLGGATITLSALDAPGSHFGFDKALTLDASALSGGLTLAGDGSGRILRVASGGDVTVRGLTVTGGVSSTIGGGAYVLDGGTLTLENVTLMNNAATGDANNGGGVYVDDGGTLVVERSTLSGNTAGRSGGGLYVLGTLDLSLSTLSGNTAGTAGGGLYLQDVTTTLPRVTLYDNDAPTGEQLRLNGGSVALAGTVLGGGDAGDCALLNGATATFRHAFVQDGTCGAAASPDALTGPPWIGPLQDNGGPTLTHLPRAGSPLVDTGTCVNDLGGTDLELIYDQRGTRKDALPGYPNADDGCDIGAVEATADEAPPLPPLIVDTADDVDDGDLTAGARSLRELIDVAPPESRITFDASLSEQTITLAGTALTIDRDLTISAGGETSIDADGQSRVFEIAVDADVALRGLTVTGGDGIGGGGILNNGHLTVEGLSVTGNNSAGGGGGLRNAGTLTIDQSTIYGNTSTHGGGGIFSNGPSIEIANSTISGNTGADGAGLFVSSDARVISSTFAANTNTSSEEARNIIVNDGGTLTIGSTVLDRDGGGPNLSIRSGGALVSNGYNLCDDACGFSAVGDQTNTEPLLDPLADNGGPTLTHTTTDSASPLIDAGTCDHDGPVDLPNDQRGLARPVDLTGYPNADDGCDIGAVETQSETTLPVELATFTATADGADRVRLAWQTASETNNARFEIQRQTDVVETFRRNVSTDRRNVSTDRRNVSATDDGWQTVGTLEGAGTTTEAQRYRFTDEALPFTADTARYRLRQIDRAGAEALSDPVTVAVSAPQAFALHGSFPNPFRSQTTIRYELPEARRVRIAVYDALGRRVRVLVDERQEAGRKEIRWAAGGLASGVYFYRISAGDYSETRKLVVVR